jgi:hypothetical protein
MDQELADRLATVERAVTDGETDLENVLDGAATADRVAELEARVEDLEDEVAELDAAVQAVRGYVGEIRAINDEVEETAAAAMAKAERAAGTDAERTARSEAERAAGTGGERATGRQPAEVEAGDRSGSAGRFRDSTDPSSPPPSAATAATSRSEPTARRDSVHRSCADGGGTTRSGSCPACGRGAGEGAGAGPGQGREPPRAGGEQTAASETPRATTEGPGHVEGSTRWAGSDRDRGDRGLLDRVRDLL